MEACRGELSVEPCDLRSTSVSVAEQDGRLVGVRRQKSLGFVKLFVEPTVLRSGIGRAIFAWTSEIAISQGANGLSRLLMARLIVDVAVGAKRTGRGGRSRRMPQEPELVTLPKIPRKPPVDAV